MCLWTSLPAQQNSLGFCFFPKLIEMRFNWNARHWRQNLQWRADDSKTSKNAALAHVCHSCRVKVAQGIRVPHSQAWRVGEEQLRSKGQTYWNLSNVGVCNICCYLTRQPSQICNFGFNVHCTDRVGYKHVYTIQQGWQRRGQRGCLWHSWCELNGSGFSASGDLGYVCVGALLCSVDANWWHCRFEHVSAVCEANVL